MKLMTKHKILLIFFLMPLSVNAQHLSFLGIPLDGNIEAFSAKLKAKGYVFNNSSKTARKGIRYFDGKFMDKDVDVYIEYDKYNNNTVYSVVS